ncbi:MAG TPA: TIGR03084 family metal-binding protein [Acidimicrobiales bacterium]
MGVLAGVVRDLVEEEASLASVLGSLASDQWDRPTPSPGWAVRDQVAHLAFSEDLATLAATDAEAFAARLVELMSDLDSVAAGHVQQARDRSPAELLAWWEASAAATVDAISRTPDGERIPWITGPMSATSFTSARIMETWAHGHDIDTAVGVGRAPTGRLRHVADLGVRTRGFSFRNRGLPVPAAEPRVALRGPGGSEWVWGPADADESVEGEALDFCLVVCRRRPVADTALRVTGAAAAQWMSIAQCFAGPPS